MREAGALWRQATLAAAIVLAMGTTARNREYQSALLLAQTAVDRYPTSVGHHVLATELIVAGRRDEAKSQLALALPAAPRAHYTLGVLLLEEKRWDEAIREFRQFVERLPYIYEAVSARRFMGMAFAGEGRWDEAAQEYRAALAMNPLQEEEMPVRLLLGEALRKRMRFDEAIEQYRLYLQVYPADVVALTGAAISLGATGRLDPAIALFQRAAAAAPGDGAVQRNYAYALLEADRPAEAVVPAQRAVALRPGDADARDVLARALRGR
jgi:protein O-GlcNAc transferase